MTLEFLFTWISQHPHWSGFIVFFIAMAESLAVVGLVVPGVAMMFAAGALIGASALPFAPICAWAVAGAISGDSLSFWFGRKYHAALKGFWPFRSYPGMIERGVDFFQRYGGRSILFGRFVGPVRGVIPLVAGMLDMPTLQFTVVNVVSAMLWAPLYLFPGMVFGASLELASKVAGRLVVLLILLVTSLWFVTWLSKLLYRYFQSRTQLFIHTIFDWSSHHPKIARLTDPILDPTQKDYVSLVVLAVLILFGGWSVSFVIDGGTSISLYILHTPWTDYLFAWIVSLAGYPATFTLFFLVSGWFLFTRQPIELIYWVFAFLFCLAAVEITERLVPGTGYIDGHVLRAGVIYGFLAVLLAGGNVSTRWRGLIYTLVSLFSITILFARVYLQGLLLESVILTLGIIILWTSILGIAYRRHRREMVSIKAPAIISMLVVLAMSGIQFSQLQEEELGPAEPVLTVSKARWKEDGWETFPAYRIQVLGKPSQPLNIQWASSLGMIQRIMQGRGWQAADPLSIYNVLHWLSPEANLAQLPILPHFNQGKREALILLRNRGENRYLILRLWPSRRQLEASNLPIWIGSVAHLQKNELLSFFTLPEEDSENSDQALALFKKDLGPSFRAGELEFLKKISAAGNKLLLLWAARPTPSD